MNDRADAMGQTDEVVRWSKVPGAEPIRLATSYTYFDFYYPECEMETKAWFVATMGRDWVTLDLGANVGIFSILFSRLAPLGQVHAFEPTSTADLLRANLRAEGAANVTVHQAAVSSCPGTREEAIYRIWDAGPERMTCPFTTVDQFVAEQGLTRLDLIKIDIDGFDLEALYGAEQTLRRFDPWVVAEFAGGAGGFDSRHLQVRDALVWMRSIGYDGPLAVMDGANYVYRRRAPGGAPAEPRVAGVASAVRVAAPAAMPAGGYAEPAGPRAVPPAVVAAAGAPGAEGGDAGEVPLPVVRRGSPNVIAYSLYGDTVLYSAGAIRNAQLAREFYPGFTCRFYHGATVPGWALDVLRGFEHVELVDMSGEPENHLATMWRFLAAADPEVDVLLLRDTDSRPGARERAAVEEWLASGQRFHIMRDNPHGHWFPILSGMWGCRGGALRDIARLIREHGPHEDDYGTDQRFLTRAVYPRARESLMVHDEYYDFEPEDFPFKRRFPVPGDADVPFVGQALDEQGRDRWA
ncbi:MAG: FkbM family methyltransferase [Chloroflexota bacterium]